MFMLIRRVCLGCTACLLLALLLRAAPAAARPGVQSADDGTVYIPLVTRAEPTSNSSFAQRVVELTNQERRRHGCTVDLAISHKLIEAANRHSTDMAINDRFSHTGSDGSTMASRIGNSYSPIAENIAVGYSTPEDVVAAWMGSDGHKKNILNCALREIGVGFYYQPDDQGNVRDDQGNPGGPYRYYWTQDLGTPLG